jgi:dTDP-glucose pyrophosphorylase
VTEISWRKCILSPENSVRDAIDNLIASSKRIILVTTHDGSFLGTVSDGDIRRGLLRGVGLESELTEVINTSAIIASPDVDRNDILKLMLSHKIQQVPIVDSSNKLLGLHEWDDLNVAPHRDNFFVIMAGGFGKRLLPYTQSLPKPMLEIAGKPILHHIIERAKSEGFSNFLVSINYLGEIIEEYFGDGSSFGVTISYIREDSPLGTAGALSLVKRSLDSTFIVTNGDVLTNISYQKIFEFHQSQNASATVAVKPFEIQNPYGVVSIDGIKVTAYQEKPSYHSFINAGVYVFEASILENIKVGKAIDMPEIILELISKESEVCAYFVHEDWTDIGTPSDFMETNEKYRNAK